MTSQPDLMREPCKLWRLGQSTTVSPNTVDIAVKLFCNYTVSYNSKIGCFNLLLMPSYRASVAILSKQRLETWNTFLKRTRREFRNSDINLINSILNLWVKITVSTVSNNMKTSHFSDFSSIRFDEVYFLTGFRNN